MLWSSSSPTESPRPFRAQAPLAVSLVHNPLYTSRFQKPSVCLHMLCVCVRVGMERPEDNICCCSSGTIHTSFLRQGLLLTWNPPSRLDCPATRPRDLSASASPVQGSHVCSSASSLFCGFLGSIQVLMLTRQTLD